MDAEPYDFKPKVMRMIKGKLLLNIQRGHSTSYVSMAHLLRDHHKDAQQTSQLTQFARYTRWKVFVFFLRVS